MLCALTQRIPARPESTSEAKQSPKGEQRRAEESFDGHAINAGAEAQCCLHFGLITQVGATSACAAAKRAHRGRGSTGGEGRIKAVAPEKTLSAQSMI